MVSVAVALRTVLWPERSVVASESRASRTLGPAARSDAAGTLGRTAMPGFAARPGPLALSASRVRTALEHAAGVLGTGGEALVAQADWPSGSDEIPGVAAIAESFPPHVAAGPEPGHGAAPPGKASWVPSGGGCGAHDAVEPSTEPAHVMAGERT